MTTIALMLTLIVSAQDKPQDIPKKELPKEAECSVCIAKGNPMELEKPAAGVLYNGKSYYFCNAAELVEFKKNPELYVPLVLPMALPELNLKDESGKTWDTEAFKGKLVLLDYWATWCKPCLALKPKVDKIWDAYKSKGFDVLSINIDEKRDTLNKFLKKKPFDNPIAFDDKQTWSKLKVITIPALFLVKNGNVVAVFRGNADAKAIEAAVKANF